MSEPSEAMNQNKSYHSRLTGGFGITFLVILNLGLSDPRHLHHTTQVQPQRKNKIMLRCARSKVNTTSAFIPKVGPVGLSPRNVGDNVAKGTCDWNGLRGNSETGRSEQTDPEKMVPSASALLTQALREQENIKHNGNITFHEIVNSARQDATMVFSRRIFWNY